MIRLTRPWFDAAETDAVQRVMASGMLVQGAEVRAFEESVSRYLDDLAPGRGETHALAVGSGTAALELALMAFDVGPGDEVIVPAVSWPSPGNAVVLRGATPVLADVTFETFNVDPACMAPVLTSMTRAVIAIDQFGVPAEIPALRAIMGGVALIEDAACALGSTLDGAPCGLLGDVGTYSFHPRKVITTAEGGMVLTRNATHASAVRALRNHGQDAPGVFRGAGPNARLSELQAAIGSAQMTKLESLLARRRSMAHEIRAAVDLPWQRGPAGSVVNHQTLGLVLPLPANGALVDARDALIAALRVDGIEAGALSHALHRLPQFARHAVNASRRFPVADRVVDGGVALPLHPGMSPEDVSVVIDGVRRHAAWAIGRPVGAA
ncbi:MAG: DegT/DnrJ/EryC1/StrS family aminotransferase [Deltaproteobacteria bacterium]